MMKKSSVPKGLKKAESKLNQNRNEGTSRTKVSPPPAHPQAKQQLQNGKRMLKNAVGTDDIEKAIDLLTEAISYSHGKPSPSKSSLPACLPLPSAEPVCY